MRRRRSCCHLPDVRLEVVLVVEDKRLMAALWPVEEQDERRRRKSAAGEGPAVAVAVLPLVRIWVRGEVVLTSVGGE